MYFYIIKDLFIEILLAILKMILNEFYLFYIKFYNI